MFLLSFANKMTGRIVSIHDYKDKPIAVKQKPSYKINETRGYVLGGQDDGSSINKKRIKYFNKLFGKVKRWFSKK